MSGQERDAEQGKWQSFETNLLFLLIRATVVTSLLFGLSISSSGERNLESFKRELLFLLNRAANAASLMLAGFSFTNFWIPHT